MGVLEVRGPGGLIGSSRVEERRAGFVLEAVWNGMIVFGVWLSSWWGAGVRRGRRIVVSGVEIAVENISRRDRQAHVCSGM